MELITPKKGANLMGTTGHRSHPADFSNHAFSRMSNEDWTTKVKILFAVVKQFEIVAMGFAESNSRVQANFFHRNAGVE